MYTHTHSEQQSDSDDSIVDFMPSRATEAAPFYDNRSGPKPRDETNPSKRCELVESNWGRRLQTSTSTPFVRTNDDIDDRITLNPQIECPPSFTNFSRLPQVKEASVEDSYKWLSAQHEG